MLVIFPVFNFDGNPNGTVHKDYTTNLFVPNFSHHKLTCFEFADGKNGVDISDDFLTYSSDRTDLDMYYEKVGLVYGQSSGRAIEPDYPSNSLDIQPKIDEFRIVGSTGKNIGISSIRSWKWTEPDYNNYRYHYRLVQKDWMLILRSVSRNYCKRI